MNLTDEEKDIPKTSMDELDLVEKQRNKQTDFSDWLSICVYEPEIVVWNLKRSPPAKLSNIMTIGVYDGHALLIKDISKLARIYACVHCQARFTQACHLQRHTQRCSQGKTVIDCPGEKVEAPQTAFEKAFFPKHSASSESIRWLEREAKLRKIHINHAMCGHSGERCILRAPVDGYHPESRTVFQFHGCYWHGRRSCFPNNRDKIVVRDKITKDDVFKATVKQTKALWNANYKVVEVWSCQVAQTKDEFPKLPLHNLHNRTATKTIGRTPQVCSQSKTSTSQYR